jgi:hypothetical protein
VREGRGLETRNRSQALRGIVFYYYNYSNDYLLINVGYEPKNHLDMSKGPRGPTRPMATRFVTVTIITPARCHHKAAVAAPAASGEGQGLETGVS